MSSEDLLVKKFLLIIATTIMKYFNTIITEFYLSTFLMLRVFAVQMKIKSFSIRREILVAFKTLLLKLLSL